MMGRSPERVDKWQEGLEQAINALDTFPRRCPLAPENAHFAVEVRQLLYGMYRILFTLVDSDGENDTVRILHVRHGAQKPLGSNDEEDRL